MAQPFVITTLLQLPLFIGSYKKIGECNFSVSRISLMGER